MVLKSVPNLIRDRSTKKLYKKKELYGRGSFAECYEVSEYRRDGNKTYACKAITKNLLQQSTKLKVMNEIKIHKTLNHKNVVRFYHFFEDKYHTYLILELCKNKTMLELCQKRNILTEPEVRYYMKQILQGVLYLHEMNIIHRDLKLSNLLLNEEFTLKIADFGLATKIIEKDHLERKLCGTTNYLAPEMVMRKGYSYEIDVWSIGCVMYALLFGKLPFESYCITDIYDKIKKCDYEIPKTDISNAAKMMIKAILQEDPKSRPTLTKLLEHDFFCGYVSDSLSDSCSTME